MIQIDHCQSISVKNKSKKEQMPRTRFYSIYLERDGKKETVKRLSVMIHLFFSDFVFIIFGLHVFSSFLCVVRYFLLTSQQQVKTNQR